MSLAGKHADNERLVRELQAYLQAKGRYTGKVDGWGGPGTLAAFRLETAGMVPAEPLPTAKSSDWPGRSTAALRAFYGDPGTGQVRLELPYRMRLAWDPDTTVDAMTCHALVRDSLRGVLEQILAAYGKDGVREVRMDLFGGCFNVRKMRGSTNAWSVHSWGAAIDLDPVHNGLNTPWPKVATMPEKVVEIFEGAGWTSLGRVIGRDAMHFQATKWDITRTSGKGVGGIYV